MHEMTETNEDLIIPSAVVVDYCQKDVLIKVGRSKASNGSRFLR